MERTSSDTGQTIERLIAVLERKGLVLGVFLVFLIASAVYTVQQPDVYTATARLLIPGDPAAGLTGWARSEANLASRLLGGSPVSDGYTTILASRTVADELIRRFGLQKRYGTDTMDATREELAERTDIAATPEQETIRVSVRDTDPKTAADMTNAYVEALDRINRERSISEGHLKRVFLETRLENVKDDLLEAESRLKMFQEEYGVAALKDQARVTIEGAAGLHAELVSAQTDLHVLRQFGTGRTNEAIRLRSRIDELKSQIDRLESGSGASEGGRVQHSLYIPFKDIPELGMIASRLQREAGIQEELFKLVTTQYELAKIEEARDMETVQILDRAVPPDQPSGPRRARFILIAGIAGFFIGVFWALTLDRRDRVRERDPQRYRQLLRSVGMKRSG